LESKRELEFELRNKGIAKEIVDQVIGESVNQESQLAMAKKLIEKKYYKWGKLPPFNRKMKMREFLGRKGFSWDVIKEVLNSY